MSDHKAKRRKRRGGDPTSLSEVVRAVYPGRRDGELDSLHAFRWWFRAVPERVYERALPVSFRSGVLTVHTATTTWASELSFLKANLLESVRKNAPHIHVRDLRFKVGPLPELRRPKSASPGPELPSLSLAQLPAPLARALAAIRDDALREHVQAAASASLARTPDDDS